MKEQILSLLRDSEARSRTAGAMSVFDYDVSEEIGLGIVEDFSTAGQEKLLKECKAAMAERG